MTMGAAEITALSLRVLAAIISLIKGALEGGAEGEAALEKMRRVEDALSAKSPTAEAWASAQAEAEKKT